MSCTRPTDAALVALRFGPGGAGLRDCGQSPVTPEANLAYVRVRRIGCDPARRRIFEAFAADDPATVRGYACDELRVGDIDTVTCSSAEGELAFTVPE